MFADIFCEQKYILGYHYVGWWLLGYKMCVGRNGVYGGSVNIVAVGEIYKASARVYFIYEGLIRWRVAVNILNKQSWTADKGWSSSFWVGCGANNSLP
jgi:hypothetical protein